MRCCGVAQEAPNLNLEEEARINRAVEGKPWDVAKLLPSMSATAAAASGASTGEPSKAIHYN